MCENFKKKCTTYCKHILITTARNDQNTVNFLKLHLTTSKKKVALRTGSVKGKKTLIMENNKILKNKNLAGYKFIRLR